MPSQSSIFPEVGISPLQEAKKNVPPSTTWQDDTTFDASTRRSIISTNIVLGRHDYSEFETSALAEGRSLMAAFKQLMGSSAAAEVSLSSSTTQSAVSPLESKKSSVLVALTGKLPASPCITGYCKLVLRTSCSEAVAFSTDFHSRHNAANVSSASGTSRNELKEVVNLHHQVVYRAKETTVAGIKGRDFVNSIIWRRETPAPDDEGDASFEIVVFPRSDHVLCPVDSDFIRGELLEGGAQSGAQIFWHKLTLFSTLLSLSPLVQRRRFATGDSLLSSLPPPPLTQATRARSSSTSQRVT